ncbi:MAG: hypothetical protein Q8O68_00800 [Candidatus Daviesbacteria bacterium]|nr:hypothetical protein [Candidatus Daviesbacteria bacterium]
MASDNGFVYPRKIVQHSKEEVADEIPTVSIKKAQVQATMDTNTLRSSYTPTSGKRGLLTYLHLASNVAETEYALTDRDGTFDIFHIGTAVGMTTQEITQQGDITRPIHAIKGSFGVYNGAGSQSTGSFTIAWEVFEK